MLERFPPEGTRVVLLIGVGTHKTGTLGVLLKVIDRDRIETPYDVFGVNIDGQTVFLFRRFLRLADDDTPQG